MIAIVAVELATVRETNQEASFAEVERPGLIGDLPPICPKDPSPDDRFARDAPNDVTVAGDDKREGEEFIAAYPEPGTGESSVQPSRPLGPDLCADWVGLSARWDVCAATTAARASARSIPNWYRRFIGRSGTFSAPSERITFDYLRK